MINDKEIKNLKNSLLENLKPKLRKIENVNFKEENNKIFLNKSASNLFSKSCNKHIKKNYSQEKQSNDYHILQNLCPGKYYCKNYNLIQQLQFKIKKLESNINDLNNMNDFFIFIINQKDKMYRDLLKENLKLRNSSSINNNASINYNSVILRKKDDKKTLDSIDSSSSIENIGIRLSNTFSRKNNNNFLRHKSLANILESKSKLNITNNFLFNEENKYQKYLLQNNPYGKILNLSNKNNNKFRSSNGISLLSLPDEKLIEMSENENLKFLIKFTQSDENFITEIRTKTSKFLVNLCDIINIMSKDYQQSIRLIKRIKLFINSGVNLVKSVLTTDSIKILLNNTCKILDCEAAYLFIYDNLSDQLILLNENGSKNNIKLPKDKGILGNVFLKKEKFKIDDTNQDIKFFKEIEKKNNIKIKNILCYPILDSSNEVFGVIQAINKNKKHFNCDDEELLLIISKQANAIIENNNNKDMSLIQISRLKLLFKYSIQLYSINNLIDLTKITEELLINLFSSSSAQILFKNQDNKLVHLTNKKIFEKNNLGIIYFVFNKKQFHGCRKIKDCKYYNSLVDISASECLVTFPIFNGEDCVGILQTIVNSDLNNITQEPKDNEKNIFSLLLELISIWYKRIC